MPKTFGILETEEVPKIGNFLANLVEFRVQKGHFSNTVLHLGILLHN